ncbi:MAG: hypothetical protein NT149_03235 [Candidatus Gottesmanbacteria bacterium]|nr:hypothetical protein [Candidatus Gottesmanbacteria bacterium]
MKWIIPAALGVCAIISVSVLVSTLVVRSQGYVRFVSAPRPDNSDYGYFEVNGSKYYQVYTPTEIQGKGIPPGAHIHAIDIRGGK